MDRYELDNTTANLENNELEFFRTFRAIARRGFALPMVAGRLRTNPRHIVGVNVKIRNRSAPPRQIVTDMYP